MLWRIAEHFEVGVKNFSLKNLYARSLLKMFLKVALKKLLFSSPNRALFILLNKSSGYGSESSQIKVIEC